jgi:hypothetical protein
MLMRPAAIAFLALSLPATAASHYPAVFAPQIDQAAASCAANGGGEFDLDPHAITLDNDLGGGFTADTLSAAGFACSTAASLYCGTGGCDLYIAVDDKVHTFFAQGWQFVDHGTGRVLLLDLHGSRCGVSGSLPCVQALIWNDGGFLTPESPE